MPLSNLSLRTKLRLVSFAISAITLALFAVAAQQSSQAFRSGKEAQLKAATVGLIDKIDRNLADRYSDVQAYAASESARSGTRERITEFMNDMMQAYSPIYDLMLVTNAKGKVIAVASADKNGKAINTEALIGTDYSEKPWFKAALSKAIKPGASYVEDLHVDSDVAQVLGNSGRVMSFTAPIRDKKTGEVLGVWTNRMSWSDVVEAIAKEEAEKIKNEQITASFPYLVNQKGVYMLHPQGAEFEMQRTHERTAPDSQSKVSQGFLADEIDLSLPGFDGKALEMVASSKGYSSYPSRGWSAILQIPAQDAQSASNTRMIWLAAVAIVLANIFSYAVIRRIITRFEQVIARLSFASDQVHIVANQITSTSQQLSKSAAGQAANTKLGRLVGLIASIKNKTKVIDDLVFESRLLSFNASIEAARAGVHGKGFSVVAEEVGKLASMSGKAADEIRTLLDSSTQECELTSSAIGVTHLNAKGAEALADQVNTLNKGAESLHHAIESIREIMLGAAAGKPAPEPSPVRKQPLRDFEQDRTHSIYSVEKPPQSSPQAEIVAFPAETSRSDSRWKSAA